MMVMNERQMQKVRKQLQSKLADLQGNSERRSELITEPANDPMDNIKSRMDLEIAVQAIDTDWRTVRAIKNALTLLDSGDYGICQECGERINPKRLAAIPWTTLCLECQQVQDLEQAGSKTPVFEASNGARSASSGTSAVRHSVPSVVRHASSDLGPDLDDA